MVDEMRECTDTDENNKIKTDQKDTEQQRKNGNEIKHFCRWLLRIEASFSICVYVFSRCKRDDRRIQGGAVEISHSFFPL